MSTRQPVPPGRRPAPGKRPDPGARRRPGPVAREPHFGRRENDPPRRGGRLRVPGADPGRRPGNRTSARRRSPAGRAGARGTWPALQTTHHGQHPARSAGPQVPPECHGNGSAPGGRTGRGPRPGACRRGPGAWPASRAIDGMAGPPPPQAVRHGLRAVLPRRTDRLERFPATSRAPVARSLADQQGGGAAGVVGGPPQPVVWPGCGCCRRGRSVAGPGAVLPLGACRSAAHPSPAA